jgi:hypothetical protein
MYFVYTLFIVNRDLLMFAYFLYSGRGVEGMVGVEGVLLKKGEEND